MDKQEEIYQLSQSDNMNSTCELSPTYSPILKVSACMNANYLAK